MKKISKIPFTSIALVISITAIAAPEKPLITKSSGGGYEIFPEYRRGEECEVYPNRVVITHRYGIGDPTALELVEERKIILNGDVLGVIDRAKAEKVTEIRVIPEDLPTTSIYANPAEDGEPVLLYSIAGKREGMFSQKLIDLINLYCPQTFDYSNKND